MSASDSGRPRRLARLPEEVPDLVPEGRLGRFFPAAPSSGDIQRIRDRIKETAKPEVIPELTWTKPPKDGTHRLYLPAIEVERRRRPDGDWIPCPLCSPNAPKCLSFCLLWSSDGRLRPIGYICAQTHFGDHQFREIEGYAKLRMLGEQAEEFLFEHLRHIPAGRQDALGLLDACNKMDRLCKLFRTGIPSLFAELRRMDKNHEGDLVVLVPIRSDSPGAIRSSSGERSRYAQVKVAAIVGRGFLNQSAKGPKAASVVQAMEGLSPSQDVGNADDAILEKLLPMDDQAKIAAVKLMKRAHRQARDLLNWLTDSVQFLSEANIEALQSWQQDEWNNFRFEVQRIATGVAYRKKIEVVRLPLASNFQVPSMSYLGTI